MRDLDAIEPDPETIVRKIIESTLMTLDGVIEDPANWVGDSYDTAFEKSALARLLESDAMLMGRRTYEILSRDWSAQTGDFADRINNIRKYVVSSTLDKADWNNSTIISGDIVDEARKLKEQDGTDLAIYGHGQLAETLLKHNLLDEMRVSVFPVLAGSGKLLFRAGEKAALRLIDARSLATGVVVMRYAPVATT